MKIISIETKTVNGREYNMIKAWAPKGFSETQYRSEVESYGSEVVHFQKLAGDKIGNVYDIIVSI
jgi:lysine/ornithine N-monooxygenase